MQTRQETGFEPIPSDIFGKMEKVEAKYRTPEVVKEILQECPRPTLYVGEVVEVKGMSFRVTRIKADGKVGLQMVPMLRAREAKK